MIPLKTDLSIYQKFNFEKVPVGVKFCFEKPEGIEPLDKKLAFCEMLKEAHLRKTPFYFTKENEDCFGKAALGMMEEEKPFGESGQLGYRWGIFQEPRGNTRLYHQNYHLGKGTVNYVSFSPFDQLNFDPDVLVFMVKPSQAEIILRAMTYSTGELYESKTSPVLGCSWLFIYPYLTGKLNYMITGLGHGMRGREVFPEGWILISIPFNWIPTVTRNLSEMQWVLPAYTAGREKFIKERKVMLDEIARGFQKP
jgi:uncharacterized protein (DUF169 family)